MYGGYLIATLIFGALTLVLAKGCPQGCVVCFILALWSGKELLIILPIVAVIIYLLWILCVKIDNGEFNSNTKQPPPPKEDK